MNYNSKYQHHKYIANMSCAPITISITVLVKCMGMQHLTTVLEYYSKIYKSIKCLLNQ